MSTLPEVVFATGFDPCLTSEHMKWMFRPPSSGLETSLKRLAIADRDGLDIVSMADTPWRAEWLESTALAGYILGLTRNVTACITVIALPGRHIPVLVRTISSLSALSGGRLILGVGAGNSWEGYMKLGLPALSPGATVRSFEEGIILLRALTGGGDPVTFEGEFHSVHDLEPSEQPCPPIWSGSLGPKSLAVTGRQADCWVPPMASDWKSQLFRDSRPIVDRAAEEAGRDPAEIKTYYNLPGRITSSPLAETRDSSTGRWVGGSVDQWVQELTTAVVEHGAYGFCFNVTADDELSLEESCSIWANEIAPAVREAVKS